MTTLILLLFGLMDPAQGEILVNGLDIREVRESDLRARMSLVPQSSDLFSGTVRYNIEFGRLGATDAEVRRAAGLARVDTLLDEKQATFDYEVGQRGGRLSVGEQQRVSIARACVNDPDVLVLDEPTASLDVLTEATIWDLVRQLAPHRIVVVVTHNPWPADLPVDVYRVDKGSVTPVETPPVVL